MKSESKVSSKLELRELVLLAMVIAIKVVLGQFKVGDAWAWALSAASCWATCSGLGGALPAVP